MSWVCADCMEKRSDDWVCPGSDCPDRPEGAILYEMATTGPPPHNLQMRIAPELKVALKEEAKAESRTETATMELILRKALKHRLKREPDK